MSNWLFFCLLATLLCWAAAKRGSISSDLFEDDINDDVEEQDEEQRLDDVRQHRLNPCHNKKCRRGERCAVNEAGGAECRCMAECETYHNDNPRLKVCSNRNETYETECDLDRDHCLCKRNKEGCQHPGVKKIQLEYYGACKELQPCSEHQRAQFPKRLRDWLFIVMETMEKRAQLDGYEEMLDKARKDKKHAIAAIWGFCDLDTDPQDRSVSRRELQYTVRSLKVFESCLVPFLDDCDADDNRRITLPEWAECLGIHHDNITEKCQKIHKAKNDKNARK